MNADLEFEVIADGEGGYAAACHNRRIYTDGESLEELYDNIQTAVDEVFDSEEKPSLEDIKLIIFGS